MSEKVVIVTGAGRGIGRAIALAFAREGARVVALARTKAMITEVEVEAVRAGAPEALGLTADVSEEEDIKAVVKTCMDRWGRIDVAVNNAGIIIPSPVIETQLTDWNKVIATNLTGSFLLMKYAGECMVAQRSGSIVNISSSSAVHPFLGFGTYSATKAGIEALTRVLAEELKEYGIRVNAISVGLTDTPAVRERLTDLDYGTLLRPEEIASVVVFLASDAASGITGATIPVWGKRM
ncbi:MAG TPA: SDR family oxidoreductase [Clostridia bacterium]|nr:SDR family oxidoreductase [Clostridia bacterium]